MIKKTALILVIILAFLLTSCAPNTNPDLTADQPEVTNAEARYSTMNACWSSYADAEKLVESADIVIAGIITDISFQVLDAKTALPPDEKTREENRWLHTIYDIDVITNYKGDMPNPAQIRIEGGVRDYRTEEQLALIKEMNAWPNDSIPTYGSEMPEIKIGETYLFALCTFDTGLPTNLIPQQSIYNLQDPFQKHTLDGRDVDTKYISSRTNQYGSPIISAKDVISVFGQDKWDAFWAQWQKDNPGWESRLDKAAVEKALAAN